MDLARAATWHRQVAALAAAADRAGLAGAELPGIQARLLAQQTGLARAAAQTRTPLPPLVPTPAEISAAGASFGDLSEAAVDQALRAANQALDATDAELNPPPAPPVAPLPDQDTPTRVALRNGLVYGGFAATVLAIQVVLLVVADESTTLPLLAPVCLVGLPAFAWLGGFLTVGAAFRAGPGVKVNRTPRLGVVVCLMPNALLCAALGLLFIAR